MVAGTTARRKTRPVRFLRIDGTMLVVSEGIGEVRWDAASYLRHLDSGRPDDFKSVWNRNAIEQWARQYGGVPTAPGGKPRVRASAKPTKAAPKNTPKPALRAATGGLTSKRKWYESTAAKVGGAVALLGVAVLIMRRKAR